MRNSHRSTLSVSAALVALLGFAQVNASAGPVGPLCGDANEDGDVTATDALLTLRTAVGSGDCPAWLCDHDGNGDILATDALRILRVAVGSPSGKPSCPPPPQTFQYVLDSIKLPVDSDEAREMGFDLERDLGQYGDNQLGGALLALSMAAGLDTQTPIDLAVASGATVELASFTASSITATTEAEWQFHAGEPTAAPPAFDGSDVFAIDVSGAPISGLLAANHFLGKLPLGSTGSTPIRLSLVAGQPPIEVSVVALHVEATFPSEGECYGRFGGAITAEDFDTQYVPAWATALNESIPDECRPGAAEGDYSLCDSASESILSIFDSDPQDGSVSLDEVRNHSFTQTLFAPDVDLLDESGAYVPITDGENDSLSFAFGFTCVAATFPE